MKYIDFNESNATKFGKKCSLALHRQGEQKLPIAVYKIRFTKEELKFLMKEKTLYFISLVDNEPMNISFKAPFNKPEIEILGPNHFIEHSFKIEDRSFHVVLAREYNNNKIKARYFQVTMIVDGEPYIKSGQLPDKLQSQGKGWLTRVIQEMDSEYKKMLKDQNRF